MHSDTEIEAIIATERARVASWLTDVPADVWPSQSLCDAWSNQDVLGHMTFPWRISLPRLVAAVVRYRGFPRAAAETASGLATIGVEAMAVELRDHADDFVRPPGAKPQDLLAEIVIHPQDIAVPAGITWDPDSDGVRALLDYVAEHPKGGHYLPKGGFVGMRFVADDLDWAWGDGPEITGPAIDVLLAMTGRRVAERIEGPGVDRLRAAFGN